MKQNSYKIGLVLTGGGARAAYQVGVLRAIADITGLERNPFSIISGFSAGAINGAWLASRSEDFKSATLNMWEIWASLTPDQIFTTDTLSLAKIAFRWLKDRGFGGLHKHKKKQITYLLDTAPLEKLIQKQIDFDALNSHAENNIFHGISIMATDYRTGHSTAFYNGSNDIQNWEKLNRISVRTRIKPDHVKASSAIPIFFPPVRIGDSFYGDGMIRLNSPLSPAIHMGAEKLVVIGTRDPSPVTSSEVPRGDFISVGEIAGTILHGLFFDALDADLDRMKRINRTLSVMTKEELTKQPDRLREIPLLSLRPSSEAASFPACEISHLPRTIAFLLGGIGVSGEKGKDLLSYLAFEPKYLGSLLEMGYEDTKHDKEKILDFLVA